MMKANVAGVVLLRSAMILFILASVRIRADETAQLPMPTATYRGPFGNVHDIAVSPDGTFVTAAFGTYGKGTGHIATWNIKTGKEVEFEQPYRNATSCVAYSPDGRYFASASIAEFLRPAELLMWPLNQKEGDPADRILRASEVFAFWDLAFTRDNTLLIGALADSKIVIWDVATREVKHKFTKFDRPVVAIAVAPMGGEFACAEQSGVVTRIDVSTFKVLQKFQVMKFCNALAYTADSKQLLIAGAEIDYEKRELKKAGISLRDIKTGDTSFVDTGTRPRAALLVPESNEILVSTIPMDRKSNEPTRLLRLSRSPLKILNAYQSNLGINCLAVSPNGEAVFAGTTDATGDSGLVLKWSSKQFRD